MMAGCVSSIRGVAAPRKAPRAIARRAVGGARRGAAANATAVEAASWEALAGSLVGEWEGYKSDYTMMGDQIALPEYFVPEAFAEWGMELKNWQIQTPIVRTANTHTDVKHKLNRGYHHSVTASHPAPLRAVSRMTHF